LPTETEPIPSPVVGHSERDAGKLKKRYGLWKPNTEPPLNRNWRRFDVRVSCIGNSAFCTSCAVLAESLIAVPCCRGRGGRDSERRLPGKSDSLVGAAHPEVHFLESCFANQPYHGIRHIHVSKTKVIPVDLLIPINAIWCLVWLQLDACIFQLFMRINSHRDLWRICWLYAAFSRLLDV